MKKHVIITSCNDKHADFLINHWLTSLKKNVKLDNVDILVIGYNLRKDQKQTLAKNGVGVVSKTKTGHIVISRFLDAKNILQDNLYDQVLFSDGGDLIFQDDISHLFNENKDDYRAVAQDHEGMPYELFFKNSFSKTMEKKIYEHLRDKPIYNAGFILAPRRKFMKLCDAVNKYVKKKQSYGPDQLVVNYILHKGHVKRLNKTYNFNINAMDRFLLIKGLFYTKNNRLIHVVHNAGRVLAWRPIINFGYGKGYNYTNIVVYYLKKYLYAVMIFFKKLFLSFQPRKLTDFS